MPAAGRLRNDDKWVWSRATKLPRLMAVALAAVALLAGCAGKPAAPDTSTTPHNVTLTRAQQQSIHVVTVKPVQYRTTITTTGVVDFDRNRASAIVAPFSGAVAKVLVTQGQHVKQGQALAEVASPDFAAAAGAYRKAVLAAKAADAVAVNDRDMYAQQAISQRENASAQADAAGADADRAAALQALVALHMSPQAIANVRAGKFDGHGVIRAPITGTVVAKSIAPGQTLAAGTTPCFTIADTAKMWVMAQVFGGDIARVHVGDTATIDAGDDGQPFTGKVTNIGAVLNPDTRSVDARVSVANPDGTLKQQMYVGVQIRSKAQLRGLLVPVAAVLRNGQNLPFVYVVAADGGYARRRVTLGNRVGDRYVIPEGLHAGDKVVVDGSIFLHFIQTQ